MSIIGRETVANEKEVGFVLTEIFKVVIVHFGNQKISTVGNFLGIRKLKIALPAKIFCQEKTRIKLPLQKNWREEWFLD